MRLSIEKAALVKALGRVGGTVERRNTIPILSNILLRAEAGALVVTASDMDMEARVSIPVVSQQFGACTVPASTLVDIAKRLPDGSVEMELDAKAAALAVRAGRTRFSLPTLPAADYPVLGAGEFTGSFEIESAALARLIDSTRFAISTEESRYYLNGIYLHEAEGRDGRVLRAVATDGHRLALDGVPLPEGASGMPGVIVPRKPVAEIRKLIDGATTVGIDLSGTKLRIEVGEAAIATKLIDGTFPDYERVIPRTHEWVLEIDTTDLADAVERVTTIQTATQAVKLSLDNDGLHAVSATGAEAASAIEELERERISWSGPALDVGFNAKYLLAIASSAAAKRLRMRFGDGGAPILISAAAQDDRDRCFVLMPMRIC